MNQSGHIFLVGFMASGKTTIGKMIAPTLNRAFFDTDELIEKQTGKMIPEIFAEWGEIKFRELETTIISSLAECRPAVIALGGGAFISDENRNIIHQLGMSIYLKWPENVLLDRLQQSDQRPLLLNKKPDQLAQFVTSLLTERDPFYSRAKLIIDCTAYPDSLELANHVVNQIEHSRGRLES